MKRILTNTKVVSITAAFIGAASLIQSCILNDVEWFQASGAVVTVAGVILAARKIIRLGFDDFIQDEQTTDGGSFDPTPEEINSQKEFEADIDAYKNSIWILIIGTLIWAYGGIILRLFGIGTNA